MQTATNQGRSRARTCGIAAAAALCATAAGCSNTSGPGDIVPLGTQNGSGIAAKVEGVIQTILQTAAEPSAAVTGVQVTGDAAPAQFSLAGFAADQVRNLLQLDLQGLAPTVTAAVTASTVACGGGGRYTVTPEAQAAETAYLLTFEDCDDATTRLTYRGSVTIANVQSTGDLSQPSTPGTLAAVFDIGGLTVDNGRSSITVQGGFNYSETSSDGIHAAQSISGTRLALTAIPDPAHVGAPPPAATDLVILYSFAMDMSQDLNTGDFSMTTSAGMHSDALSGYINFTTAAPLTGQNATAKPPTGGVVTITGRLNSSLTVKPLVNHVTIDVDSNGDGKIDFTLHSQWSPKI